MGKTVSVTEPAPVASESSRQPQARAEPPEPATHPELSVIVVTLDEAENLEGVVRSLLDQHGVSLEVLVVDGGSTDGTADIARHLEARHAPRVRLVASRPLPIGPARNLGIQAARAPAVAFVSADTTVAPGWARAMMDALADADVVYGRQEHAPSRLGVAAVVRGLRYHHFRSDRAAPPEAFASNVNAAVRRVVFDRLRYVHDGPASALDDILFTHEAQALGLRVAYRPDAVVHHKDAASFSGELTKNRREGYGWGILSPTLGPHRTILAWGGLLLTGILVAALAPAWWSLALLSFVVWAPALRRVVRGGASFLRRAPVALVGALLVSPLFDLVFLFHYLRGLRARRPGLTGRVSSPGAIP